MSRLKVHPQQNVIVEVQEAQERPTVEENFVGNLEQGMIQKILLPCTVSMRILGLYFEKTDKLRTTKQYSRFYCLFITVILWLNAIRIFTIFTADDRLQTVLLNIASVVLLVSGAILQTSCYRASLKGRVPEVLQTLNKDVSCRWAKRLRMQVVLGAGIAWSVTAFMAISSGFYMFFSEYGYLTTMIAPFNTIILNSNPLTLKVLDGLLLVLLFYSTGATTFSLVWSYLLSSIISHEFKKCTKMLQGIVKNPAAAKRNFEMVRCHHQTLCRMVDKVDGYVCVNNATYIVEFIFIIVLYLYGLMCEPIAMSRDPFNLFSTLFWIFSCVLGLIVVACGGIMINLSAHEINEKIHDIDLTNLNAETIGQINTLLYRVCGEPIGFTVLRIFVIDRNTILTILGLLITYFLLIVQLYPPSPDNQWIGHPRLHYKVSTNPPPTTGAINNATGNFF